MPPLFYIYLLAKHTHAISSYPLMERNAEALKYYIDKYIYRSISGLVNFNLTLFIYKYNLFFKPVEL